jgi:hypothetical protein
MLKVTEGQKPTSFLYHRINSSHNKFFLSVLGQYFNFLTHNKFHSVLNLLFCHCSHYHPNIIDVTDSYCGINFDCKIKKMFHYIWRPLYLVFYHLLSPSVSVGSLTQSLNLWVWQMFYQFTLPFTPCKN